MFRRLPACSRPSDPYISLSLQPDLRRSQHMPGGMQADANAMVFNRFAIIQRLQADIGTEPGTKQIGAVAMRQIMRISPSRMVTVRMRDHSAITGRQGSIKNSPSGQYKPSGRLTIKGGVIRKLDRLRRNKFL